MRLTVSLVCVVVLAGVFSQCEGALHLFSDKVNWFEAQQRCRACGKELAILDSQAKTDEANALIANISKILCLYPFRSSTTQANYFFLDCHETDSYWIDGTDLALEGTFKWFSTGQNLCYFNWKSGQPNDCHSSENCISLYDGYWYDSACSNSYAYLCQDDPCHC